MKCEFCGRELKGTENFCNGCGSPVTKKNEHSSVTSFEASTGVPNNNNKKFFITILVLIVIGISAFFFVTSFKSDNNGKNNDPNEEIVDNTINNNGNNEEESEGEAEENVNGSTLSKNVSVNGVAIDDSLYFFIKNNNKIAVDGKLDIEFYDANGKILGSETIHFSPIASGVEIFDECWDYPVGFSSYKTFVEVEETDSEIFYNDIEVSDNDTGEEIVVQAKNNSNKKIEEITVGIIFYKNGEIVGLDYDYEFDINSGRSAVYKFYYPFDYLKFEDIDFDNYKVMLMTAYNF